MDCLRLSCELSFAVFRMIVRVSQPNHSDQILDATDVSCPLPLLKTKMALKSMESGKILLVKAKDAGSWNDIPKYLSMSEHALSAAEEVGGEYHFWIIKGEK